jgi:hypothetical protein
MASRTRSLIPRLSVAVLVLTLSMACSPGGGADVKPTITEQQARDKVAQYIDGAFAALPKGAGRTLFAENRSECTDPTDNGPRGRYEISSTYEVTGLDAAQHPEHFAAVVQWWTTHDFVVLTDKRPADQYVFARNKADSFDMSVEGNDLGKLYLGATSPCVWPNGTPDPQADGLEHAGTDAAVAAPAVEQPPVVDSPPQQVRKPRRSRPAVDDEDFAETDWTDGSSY